MSYAIQRNDQAGLAHVVFTGNVHIEDRERALAELTALLDETGWRKVLMDFSCSRPSTAMTLQQALQHAHALVGFASRAKGVRIAYVFPSGRPPVVELIAASRGYHYGRFGSRGSALEWLGSEHTALKSAA